MIDIFPKTKYTFYLDTLTGACQLDFPQTQYHEPVPGVALTGHELAIQEARDYFSQNNVGMWGYPIESLDFCAPLDVHANLLLNKNLSRSKLIRDFRVIGFIPDELPVEIHPDNHNGIEDDEDGEEGTEVIFEAADWREELSAAMSLDITYIFESAKEPWDLKPGVVENLSKKVANEINKLGFKTKPSAVVASSRTTTYIKSKHGKQLSKEDEIYLREAIRNPDEILPNTEEEGKEYRGKSVLLVHEAGRNYIAIVEISPSNNDNMLWNFWKMGTASARNYLAKFRSKKAQLLQSGGMAVDTPHVPHNTPEGEVGKPEGLSGSQIAQSSFDNKLHPDSSNVKKILESGCATNL